MEGVGNATKSILRRVFREKGLVRWMLFHVNFTFRREGLG
jgi:hypothetical protein